MAPSESIPQKFKLKLIKFLFYASPILNYYNPFVPIKLWSNLRFYKGLSMVKTGNNISHPSEVI